MSTRPRPSPWRDGCTWTRRTIAQCRRSGLDEPTSAANPAVWPSTVSSCEHVPAGVDALEQFVEDRGDVVLGDRGDESDGAAGVGHVGPAAEQLPAQDLVDGGDGADLGGGHARHPPVPPRRGPREGRVCGSHLCTGKRILAYARPRGRRLQGPRRPDPAGDPRRAPGAGRPDAVRAVRPADHPARAQLDAGRPISQHLDVLEEAGLVTHPARGPLQVPLPRHRARCETITERWPIEPEGEQPCGSTSPASWSTTRTKALQFYTDVLGFVKKTDVPVGEHRG